MIDVRTIWARDSHRCQECGVQVAKGRGLKPHTHHKVPKDLGGSDDEDNLVTLCHPCHETKLGHTFMLERAQVTDFPQYIKWSLWDLSLNLLAYADSMNPRRFPAAEQVRQYLEGFRQAVASVQGLCAACHEAGIGVGDLRFCEDLVREQEQLADIVKGMRIAWTAHYTQGGFDQIIGEAAERSRVRCPACGTGRLQYTDDGAARRFICSHCGLSTQRWR